MTARALAMRVRTAHPAVSCGRDGTKERGGRVNRRALLLSVLAGVASDLGARAESYPSRPVKVIVPFAAGGPLDLVARGLTEKFAASLKQPFVIENRPGAGGNIGTEAAAKAVPDGYTLLMVLSGTLTANPALYG